MDDYIVIYKDLPYKVKAFTMYNAVDNYYTIVLNSRLSYQSTKKAFSHEMRHIGRGDFYSEKNVGEIESLAHSF